MPHIIPVHTTVTVDMQNKLRQNIVHTRVICNIYGLSDIYIFRCYFHRIQHGRIGMQVCVFTGYCDTIRAALRENLTLMSRDVTWTPKETFKKFVQYGGNKTIANWSQKNACAHLRHCFIRWAPFFNQWKFETEEINIWIHPKRILQKIQSQQIWQWNT